MIHVAGILVALAGYWLGARLGSTRTVNVAALAALVVSGLGVIFWPTPPFRYLFEAFRLAYVLVVFAVFFLSAGVLVRGILVRAGKAMHTSLD